MHLCVYIIGHPKSSESYIFEGVLQAAIVYSGIWLRADRHRQSATLFTLCAWEQISAMAMVIFCWQRLAAFGSVRLEAEVERMFAIIWCQLGAVARSSGS